MSDKRWNILMKINKKVCNKINNLKKTNNTIAMVNLTLDELYEIANLSGNEATIIKRVQ